MLEVVFNSVYSDLDSQRIDLEDHSSDGLIKQESSMIRKFLEYRSDKDLLLKSEGGKPKLKTAVASLSRELLDYLDCFELYVVIDLDGGSIDGIIEDIDEELETRSTTNRASLEKSGSLEPASPFLIQDTVFSYRHLEYEIRFITLEYTLEDVANIDKNTDSGEDQRQKVRNISQREDIQSVLSEYT
ncbi:hypothetical protein [Halosimplex pelagicum]|uniref:Uncharacterized protein n=1 Tax=Halosimplex pelagicum TaxID=869886 RepID=A0A7D5P874_9EURY|nr:hypothetical protein [Halosimplex pelagicum]QLH83246.1 hypothetical protein HZS54_17125 [Halosimplex pelagicum]